MILIVLLIFLFVFQILQPPRKLANILYDNYVFSEGISMKPLVNRNSILYYDYVKNESEITINSFIIYYNGENYIGHNVIGMSDDDVGKYFILKGTNNLLIDNEKVRLNQIIGKVKIIQNG